MSNRDSELVQEALTQSLQALGHVYNACTACQNMIDNVKSMTISDLSKFDDLRGTLALCHFDLTRQLERLDAYENRR